MTFEVGAAYTRADIHARVGGGTRICLPSRDGRIVAACLLRSLNPEAPHVVLCGTGPRNGSAGAHLADQRGPIPMFTKAGTGRWIHEGRFVVVASFVSGPRFDRHVARSSRPPSDVSRVVVLEALR